MTNGRNTSLRPPAPPLPWMNDLGSEDFLGMISNTMGGYCFYWDAKLQRLLRCRYNAVPTDLCSPGLRLGRPAEQLSAPLRGCRYTIHVRRTGVRSLAVDGKALSGDLVPISTKNECTVEVTL